MVYTEKLKNAINQLKLISTKKKKVVNLKKATIR